MDPEHIVEVSVRTKAGRFEIGTGYPVAPGRILTAKHVLGPEAASREIVVRWYNLKDAARERRPARLVWAGTGDLDAAILECEFPAAIKAAPYLISSSVPQASSQWSSAGFAAAGVEDGASDPVPLSGRVLPHATDPAATGEFHLGVDYAPEEATDWQGASGGPVFVEHRIVGVLVSSQRPFEGRRLAATATCRLLQEAEFRAAVGYKEKWKRLQDYRDGLVERIGRSVPAARALAEAVGVDASQVWSPAATREVVERLLDQRLEELLPKLNQAHGRLFRRSRTDADVIRDLTWWVIPAVCDVADAQVSQWQAGRHGLLRLPAATVTLAEIILASVDGRDVRFQAGGEPPEPLLRIPVPPPGGETDDLTQFEWAWHDYVIKKFVDPRALKNEPQDALVKLAAAQLSDLAEIRKETYYYVLDTSDPEEDDVWAPVIERLSQQYPSVVFVKLFGSGSDFETERRLAFHLTDMLRRGAQARAR